MSWLCINPDGSELIFIRKPTRTKSSKRWSDASEVPVYRTRTHYSAYHGSSNETIIDHYRTVPSTKCKLPKGTIEFMIRKKLTTKDEPYKLIVK